MRKRMLVALAGVGLVATACGGSGGDGLAAAEDYSVLGALAELPPAPDDAFLVQTADLASATELADLERPAELDPAAVSSWIGPLTGVPLPIEGADDDHEWVSVFVPPPTVAYQGVQRIEEFDELAGWSLVDIDSYVEYGTAPHAFTVLSGEFDEDTLGHLPEAADGVRTVGEGEDGHSDFSAATAVSQIGQPIRMAQADGLLAVSGRTDVVQDWLEGPEETLADHEGLAALAAALDDAGVVSAMLSAGESYTLAAGPLAGSLAPGAEDALTRLEEEMDYLPEHPFDAVAIGWTAQDGDPVMVAAYHFGSDEAAEASVEPLRTVYTEGTNQSGIEVAMLIDLEEITADGPVVVATLGAARPGSQHRLPAMLVSHDIPFLHQ